MVHPCKVNLLVFKPLLPALNQHLFRQNSDTREQNCRKLWTFNYLTAQPWAPASLSINKERKSPSWGDGVLATKLTKENEGPWWVLTVTNIINNSKPTWGKKYFSQSSKTQEIMAKKESVSDWTNVLTPQDQDILQCSVPRKKQESPRQPWKSLVRQHRCN